MLPKVLPSASKNTLFQTFSFFPFFTSKRNWACPCATCKEKKAKLFFLPFSVLIFFYLKEKFIITGIWFKTILYKDTQKAVCRSSRIFIFLIDACQKSIQVFCIDIVNRPLLIRKAGFNDIEDHPVVVSSRTAAG